MITLEMLYVLVLVLCAMLFLKVAKSTVKLVLIVGVIAMLVVYVIPKVGGF